MNWGWNELGLSEEPELKGGITRNELGLPEEPELK